MVGLRLKQGISLAGVNQVYGEAGLKALEKAIAPHIRQQWVIVEPDADVPFGQNVTKFKPTSRIRLSDPEGFLMSNQVIVDAFNALEAL
ncbi:hypothetical protein BH23CYA1_BH23CYA1_09690 [soil metagenome]